jgi:hypothetical protein
VTDANDFRSNDARLADAREADRQAAIRANRDPREYDDPRDRTQSQPASSYKDVVVKVHTNFVEMRAEAERQRDSPRHLALLDNLILLTADEDEARDTLDEKLAAENAKPKCLHAAIDPANGKCKDCGKQIFGPRISGV